jgi:thiamine-phosphate pyrophosphorylase
MPRYQARLPSLWLMTDPRMGNALWPALARLPKGSGIIFRHYGVAERRALFARVRRIAHARRLVLLLAGTPREARGWRADGVHGTAPGHATLRTAAVHDAKELRPAIRVGADLVLLSPVFATRSHPGAPALGRVRFGLLARKSSVPVIALGGVDGRNIRALHALGAYGRAGIDAFL